MYYVTWFPVVDHGQKCKGQWVKMFSRDSIQQWNFVLPSQKLCHDTLQQISEDCMANWFTSSQLND